VTYDDGSGPRAGVLVEDRVHDAATLLGERGDLLDVGALVELPNGPLDRLRAALTVAQSSSAMPLSSVRLRAPILQPPTLRDFFVYEGHANSGGARQLSEAWYRLPIFYFS